MVFITRSCPTSLSMSTSGSSSSTRGSERVTGRSDKGSVRISDAKHNAVRSVSTV